MSKYISTCLATRLAIIYSLLLFGFYQITAQPAGFSDQLFVGGMNNAVGLTFDNNDRMFVWEKGGKVWIVENGVKLPNPLIDLEAEVGNWRDFGLLGFALDPEFLTNGYIYLCYTVDRHHLLYFGTNQYNANTNEYFNATIGRVTRYTAQAATNFTTVDYNSRLVLIGETKESGIPSLHESHGIGQIVFGEDHTLLVCAGDGASYNAVDQGSDGGTYYQQALTDGIITPGENIGAYRCQSLNSLNGKILRIDPATGDGVPSNPYYNSNAPRSAASRVWARGVRNPYRITHKPETGSHFEVDGDPGVFYFGDVGWSAREELNVVSQGGQNFGWPKFEGMTHQPGYNNNTYTPAVHQRPIVDWRTGSARALVNGSIYNIGSAQVPGTSFVGNASTGGVWYTGTDFPEAYQNTYFHADYGNSWVRQITVDANDQPTSVQPFLSNIGPVVFVGTSPVVGGLFYVRYPDQIRRIVYNNNANNDPTAIASADHLYGNSPFTVQFTGNESGDPDNNPLSFLWNFGDGTTSTLVNPIHTYTSAGNTPVAYTVTLTVTDGNGGSDQATLQLSANNTPPVIQSTSIDNLNLFSSVNSATVSLNATVSDAESNSNALSYEWTTFLMHNGHQHAEAVNNTATTTTTLSPIGCDGVTYWYRIQLKVTDPGGLSTTYQKDIYPDCSGNTQTINFGTITDKLVTNGSFSINPSASSGLGVSAFIIEGPATIVNNTITLTGEPGEVTVRAVQGGNGSFQPAIPVNRSFFVHPRAIGNQSINFPAIADQLTTNPPFNLNATASSGLTTSYIIRSGPAQVNGSTVTLNGNTGTVTVAAYQRGNLNWYPAIPVDRNFNVGTGCTDADNDGVCQPDDCNDNDASVPAAPGTPCNDNNATTNNDVIQADGCTCLGTGVVTDCSAVSLLPGANNLTISGLNTPVAQIQVFNSSWATTFSCSGNCNLPTQSITGLAAGTYYVKVNLYTANWSPICEITEYVVIGGGGGCTDNDGDGICVPTDCDDNNPNLPAPVGSSCNDNNANTTNDIIQSDGCTCAGTPTGPGDCSGITMTSGPGSISVGGLTSPITQVQIFNSSWATILNCAGNCASPTQTVNNLANGTYYVKARLYTANWGIICDVEQYVTVGGGGGGCTDNDNDGVCANIDCNDDNPNLPATVGSVCNDNNANTTNDVIQSDGCTCAGTPTGGGGDPCDNINFTFTGGVLTVTGLDTRPVAILQVFNSSWAEVFKCAGNCNGTENITLPNGTYFVKASLYTSSWSPVCTKESYLSSSTNLVSPQNPEEFFFSVVKDGRKAGLYWVTNTAYKNERFEIERSSNGIDFGVVGEKLSEQDSWNTPFHHTAKDEAPLAGSNFYRIKKIHHDGTEAYSQTRELVFDMNLDDFTVYPNPASTEIYIHLKNFAGASGTISIYNAYGNLVAQRLDEVISEEAIRFSTIELQSGLYLVVVQLEDKKMLSKKLVIARE